MVEVCESLPCNIAKRFGEGDDEGGTTGLESRYRMSTSDPVREGGARNDGWGGALVRAAIVVIASFVGFVIVPDRLLSYLATRAVPNTRDGLVVLWVVAFFVAMSYGFVALQRKWER